VRIGLRLARLVDQRAERHVQRLRDVHERRNGDARQMAFDLGQESDRQLRFGRDFQQRLLRFPAQAANALADTHDV